MSLSSRTRREPDGTDHEILVIAGLGPGNDADIEPEVADRASFGTALLSNQGGSGAKAESAWKDCTDRAVIRLSIEYRNQTVTDYRAFIVAMRSHDGTPVVEYRGPFTPENSGDATDCVTGGNGMAMNMPVIDCRGMNDFKIIVRAATGGEASVAVDAYGVAV